MEGTILPELGWYFCQCFVWPLGERNGVGMGYERTYLSFSLEKYTFIKVVGPYILKSHGSNSQVIV